MSEEIKMNVLRPFGPSVAKINMPEELINNLNNHVDKTILDIEKLDELDHGSKLAGNVKQEFLLEKDFVQSSGFLNFLGTSTRNWIKFSGLPEIKKFNIIATWAVRQFKNEYNPTHWHGGHVSGVGYLKVPDSLGKPNQDSKKVNQNGHLELIHGTKMFLCKSTFKIEPKVGDFYFFPNYLMHAVYPFSDTDDERRSVSFNAKIDENVYDVYAD